MSCRDCGGHDHNLLEPCSGRAGLVDLLVRWTEGERTALAHIAVAGVIVIPVLMALGLYALIGAL